MPINYRIFRTDSKVEVLGSAKESLGECERILKNLIEKNPGYQYRIEKCQKELEQLDVVELQLKK